MRAITTHKTRRSDPGPRIEVGDNGPGGAPHAYKIAGLVNMPDSPAYSSLVTHTPDTEIDIVFQHGGVPENGVNGVTIEALLAICIDRLEQFQAGIFACPENHIALDAIRHALDTLHHRTRDRYRRGVEGRAEP